MALKDILVYLDESKQAPQRLDTAIAIAEQHQAHLTGLAVAETAHIPDFMPRDLVRRQQELARERNQRIKKAFEDRVANVQLSTEWREVDKTRSDESVLDVLALHAHYSDLVVVGQPDPEKADGTVPLDLPGKLAMVAGRPVMGIPYAWRPAAVGRRVLVAWNASREATRAVHDALPMLQQAEDVRILALTRKRGLGGHGEMPGADIAAHLARHGVKAEAEHGVVEDIRVPEALLSAAADYGADLLVMGAYGRPRLREIMLGGASHGVLQNMTVPVLMGH
ncbi:MAG: universal stress protein [Ectothiorhodospiraceae bacterium]|jgi:nucleotide-binding universal stress UspA family protein